MGAYDHKPQSEGTDFLKLGDGDQVTLRICTLPHYRKSVFDPSENKGVDTSGWGDSEYKQAIDGGLKVSERYSWGVFVRKINNTDVNEARIYEGPPSVYLGVADLARSDWGDPMGYDIILSRRGEKLDTRYSVNPGKNQNPTTEEEQDEVNKFDLSKILGARELSDDGEPVPEDVIPKDVDESKPPF